ncbi:MAG: histidine ammonia-lyase [Lewinellaceae bacterium]|nr:histidine ammonia-lyase [Saprospiraceae bacterium]MCB9312894.1 histidine ammonia-lyase [Lewinellaceae bacterium]HRW74419.1 histidine ammonia-lyase [Saprospiraceae bacterium]
MTAIDADHLSTTDLLELARRTTPIQLNQETLHRTSECRQVLDRMISRPDALYYGINTGFGDLCNVSISPEDIEQLQRNLILSHACGTGEEVPPPINDLIQLLKIRNLTLGFSGVRADTLQLMVNLFNAGVRPVIHTQGSLGASGDLAPLAHLALVLIGEGKTDWQGQRLPARDILNKLGWPPLNLGAKEGLALLNGTQFSTAYGVWAVEQGRALLEWADAIAALSMDAFLCQAAPLDDRLHQLRRQPGQIAVASRIRHWLAGSPLGNTRRPAVQDPYAFRCVPQVHGASRDAWGYTRQVIDQEINAVTDNPTIFPGQEDILSGGNFHAQPIALALDFLAIALAELASISERRIFQLVSGKRDLPPFLVNKPGLHSGLMIAQYTAASIVSQSKQLCTPASVDSIVSSNGQEDHVSMAANAATKLYRVVENTRTVLAIEWMTAAQALDFRRPLASSAILEPLVQAYRTRVPFLSEDRIISDDIHQTIDFLQAHDARIME